MSQKQQQQKPPPHCNISHGGMRGMNTRCCHSCLEWSKDGLFACKHRGFLCSHISRQYFPSKAGEKRQFLSLQINYLKITDTKATPWSGGSIFKSEMQSDVTTKCRIHRATEVLLLKPKQPYRIPPVSQAVQAASTGSRGTVLTEAWTT